MTEEEMVQKLQKLLDSLKEKRKGQFAGKGTAEFSLSVTTEK